MPLLINDLQTLPQRPPLGWVIAWHSSSRYLTPDLSGLHGCGENSIPCHREFFTIPKLGGKWWIYGFCQGFEWHFPNWENATKTNPGFPKTHYIPKLGIKLTQYKPSNGITLTQLKPSNGITLTQLKPNDGITPAMGLHWPSINPVMGLCSDPVRNPGMGIDWPSSNPEWD